MRMILALLLLVACTPFPDLSGTISDSARAAPYPVLAPVEVPPQATDDSGAEIDTRIAALRARADEIRQIDIAALQ